MFLCFWSITSIAQVSSTWNYPIGPGSNEWKASLSVSEHLSYYNIPETTLSKMSTEELVKTCLKYPELRMIFTRNSLIKGYDYIKSQFNGFRELEKRTDAGKYLLNAYQNKKHDDVVNLPNDTLKGYFMFSILYIELMISQEPIIRNMSKDDQISLKNQAITSFESEGRLNKYFGDFLREIPALILTRILVIKGETNAAVKDKLDPDIMSFFKNSEFHDSSVWLKVYNLAKIMDNL